MIHCWMLLTGLIPLVLPALAAPGSVITPGKAAGAVRLGDERTAERKTLGQPALPTEVPDPGNAATIAPPKKAQTGATGRAGAGPPSLEASCQTFAESFYDWYFAPAQKAHDGPSWELALKQKPAFFSVVGELARLNGKWTFVNFHYPAPGGKQSDLLTILKQGREDRKKGVRQAGRRRGSAAGAAGFPASEARRVSGLSSPARLVQSVAISCPATGAPASRGQRRGSALPPAARRPRVRTAMPAGRGRPRRWADGRHPGCISIGP